MTALDWLLVLLAVIGTVHVSVLKRAYVGHWFWVGSNLGLLATKAWAGDYPMAVHFGSGGVEVIVECLSIRKSYDSSCGDSKRRDTWRDAGLLRRVVLT